MRRGVFCPNTPSTAAGVLLSKASDKEQMMVNAKTKMATRQCGSEGGRKALSGDGVYAGV